MEYSKGDTLHLEELGEVTVTDTNPFREKVQIDIDGTKRWMSKRFIDNRKIEVTAQ